MFPRRVYIIKLGERIVGLRRFGHWQKGEHAGEIKTPEAIPIVVDGVAYSCTHEGNLPGEYYTCHLWHGDDATIEEVLGMKIEEMG